jgi:hypothetical protein
VYFGDLLDISTNQYGKAVPFFAPKTPRRSRRHWLAIPVRIDTGYSRIDGVTINLSEHGMFVFAAANLPIGATVELAYRPPDRPEAVSACAIVRRKAVYLYGIEVLNSDVSQKPPTGKDDGLPCDRRFSAVGNSQDYRSAM